MPANERQHGGTHYQGAEYQHWDWARDCKLPYLPGNASKYVFRWRKKNGVEDLEKAIHYLEKTMEVSIPLPFRQDRAELFWKLIIQNNVHVFDAAALYYIMEGHYPQALELLRGLLEIAKEA